MHDVEAFDSTIGLIYGSAVDDGLWPQVLPSMARLVGCDGGQMAIATPDYSQVIRSDVYGFPKEANDEYVAYYHQVDPRARMVIGRPAGIVMQDHLQFDESFISHNEYYQDFLPRYDCRYATLCRLDAGPQATILYAMLTRPSGRPISAEGVQLLKRLHQHLQRATSLHLRLAQVQTDRDDLVTLIDALKDAVFVVSRDGRIRHLNRAAKAVARAVDGLVVRYGLLAAHSQTENEKLKALLAWRPGTNKATLDFHPSLRITRRPPAPPLNVSVVPLSESGSEGTGSGEGMMVWAIDPTQRRVTSPDQLVAWYGLTLAEARVASMLVAGLSPAEIAETLAVTVATVRTQMAATFAKTRTARQSELVELLSRAVPPLAASLRPSLER